MLAILSSSVPRPRSLALPFRAPQRLLSGSCGEDTRRRTDRDGNVRRVGASSVSLKRRGDLLSEGRLSTPGRFERCASSLEPSG